MKTRKLADVLWEAANVHLESTPNGYRQWSCNAALVAEGLLTLEIFSNGKFEGRRDRSKSDKFLRSLGCDTRTDAPQFPGFFGQQLQGVRYMWLLLAMHVAEDEGIEIPA